ncbi:MAG: hypothetical protein FWE57_12200 [Chitinispirillia bacterium]|nr:hypothetical protein [Chitinispirillia bacterium]
MGFSVAPAATDLTIKRTHGDHYVSVNRWAAKRDVLFLFFPGTKSRATNYKMICDAAADMGFHAISLQYINDISVNFTCAKFRDLDCYENMRREILFGDDASPHLNVNWPNSAENRLIKLLEYLHNQYPLDGWDQYLDATGAPDWSKMLIAGHSQGGGHAALLGRYYYVAGVIMFASVDFNINRSLAANWVNQESATDIGRYFAAAHTEDRTIPIAAMRSFWNAFGFRQLGPVINIDHTGFPYGNSHTFITSINPARLDRSRSNYHNALCMDADTPVGEDEKPLLLPFWRYLFNAPFQRE